MNKTGILLVGAVVVVAGALIAVWMFWWEPRTRGAGARGHVTAWEERWTPARACLLGDAPLATDPADALALAELQTGSMASNAAPCTNLIKGITRPEGGGSAGADVEAAFREVEAAIPAVARAYAMRISAEPDEIDRRVHDLGIAIGALDGAHDRLRATAGMPPIDRTGSVKLTRLAEPTPLVAGGAPFLATSAHATGGVVRDEREGSVRELLLATGPDQTRRLRTSIEAIASVPGATWMVATLPARVFDTAAAEGAIAVAAMPASEDVDFTAATAVVPPGAAWIGVAALGDGDARTVVLGAIRQSFTEPAAGPAFMLATSTDGGKSWTLGPSSLHGDVVGVVSDPVDGSVIISLSSLEGFHTYRLDAARPFEIPEPLLLDPTWAEDPDRECRSGGSRWWIGGEQRVVGITGPKQVYQADLGSVEYGLRVIDCTATSVLVEEDSSPVRYRRCDPAPGGCAEVLQGGTYAYGRAALGADGTVYYAAGRGAVLALWSSGTADATYFKLPRAHTLDAVVVWNGAPYALLHDPKDDTQALLAVKLD